MRTAAIVCLLLSGTAALIDEVVWGRGVGVLLGSTAEAHALTLGVFMGGLALGAMLLGRLADRTRNPLRLYAALEIGVALTTVATPAMLRVCTSLFETLAADLYPDHPFAVGALKALIALLLLLPPTILMGGTLPVMVRALVRSGSEVSVRVSHLYAANSAGGVLGTLLGGLVLVNAIGLDRCALFASVLNVAAAVVALLAAKEVPTAEELESETTTAVESTSPKTIEPASPAPLADGPPQAVVLAMLVAMGISGIASLVYETLWIRLLSLVLGGTAHAFPLMLSAFIGGITVGSFWAGRRLRRWDEALATFVRVEILAAVVVGIAFWAYHRLPWLILLLGRGAAKNEPGYALYLLLAFAFCLVVMAIPAACIGATLPLASQVAAGELRGLGRRMGGVYAWNTVGNVIGAVAGGLVLLPALGMKGAFLAGITINVVAGLLPLVVATRSGTSKSGVSKSGVSKSGASSASTSGPLRTRRPVATPALVGFGAVLLLAATPFEPQLLSRGVFRLHGAHPGSYADFRADYLASTQLLFHEDGANATVEVHEHEDGTRSLRINGKPDASTGKDMQTQLLCGHLPMLLHPSPKNVLVVGLGSGVTVAAALRYGPDVRVTVLELSPEVVRASDAFREANDDALDDPRVRLVVDDARTFVRLDPTQYDVIIAEPSNPWMAGISGLFTRDFFLELQGRLAPGGVLLQWVQLYETSDDIVSMVVRTFRSVYGDATAWGTAGADLFLISGADPMTADWNRIAQRMREPQVADSLERARVTHPAALAGLHMLSRDGLAAYAGQGDLHTDAWPQLEFAGARALFVNSWARQLIDSDERRKHRPRNLAISAWLRGRAPDADEAAAIASAVEEWAPHTPELYVSALRRAAEQDPAAHWKPLAKALEDGFPNFPLNLARSLDPGEGPHRARALYDLGHAAAVEQLLQSSAFRPPVLEPAIAAITEALELGLDEEQATAWAVLARLHAYAGNRSSARDALLRARGRPDALSLSEADWQAIDAEIASLDD